MHAAPRRRGARRGTTLVECALVYPLAILLIVGMIAGAIGVFRYQQVASLAREGARWAAVHGPTYQSENGGSAPTPADVKANAIAPRLAGLRASDLDCSVSYTSNTVAVTLTYRWSPGFLRQAVTFRSTAVAPITY
jgi:Flp pilus assembly protein TadG